MSVGIDIGSRSVKVVELEKQGAKHVLKGSGIVGYSGIPIEDVGGEKELSQLAVIIKKLFNEAKISKSEVVLSLPEKQVFTRVISFPMLSDQEIDSAVKWEAEQYVPIPSSDAVTNHMIIERRETATPPEVLVLLVATQKKIVEKYVSLLNMAGLSAAAIESELIAVTRSLAPIDQTVMLVDLGATSTDIGISRNGNLVFSRSIPTAGDALTRAVAQNIGVEGPQAEEYKKTYGLNQEQLEGKVKQALDPVFKMILDEIKKALHYYQSEEKGTKPTQIIITGGSSGLPGLIPMLSTQLNTEVIVGNPFAKITVEPEVLKQIANYTPLYSVAAGLALREE